MMTHSVNATTFIGSRTLLFYIDPMCFRGTLTSEEEGVKVAGMDTCPLRRHLH